MATLGVFHVNVTNDHIVSGLPGSTSKCPLALAVRDAVPGVKESLVGSIFGCVIVDGLRWWWGLPCEAKSFQGEFDAGIPVDRLEFDIEPTRAD